MRLKLWLSANDNQDGSFTVRLHNTKKEALKALERTEKEIKEGCFYEDGMFKQVELEIDEEGNLVRGFNECIE